MNHRVLRWLYAAALGASAIALTPAASFARSSTKVEWASIRVPAAKGSERTTRVLRGFLTQAAKKADFGSAKSVKLSARVVEFTSVKKGDILQVSCTIVGRLVGGPSARSRISFGGNPNEREELEKQVLSMVANGLVTRLAEIARTQAARKKAEAEADAEKGRDAEE
jgi:hypothetical protein